MSFTKLATGSAAFALIFVACLGAANAAAADLGTGIPCAGFWLANNAESRYKTDTVGPILQFYESWGPNGWIRGDAGDPKKATFSSWHIQQFNDEAYQVFGDDPGLSRTKKITKNSVLATSIRLGSEANSNFVIFSSDCSRLTRYKPEGIDRHARPGHEHYYDDTRVFSKVLPPKSSGAGLPVAEEFFEPWILNRTQSHLTRAPKEAEAVVIVPWENSGWLWNLTSGGPYQPENLLKGVKRVECGAATGAAARLCEGPKPYMTLYWATWDGRPYPSYGTAHGEVRLTRVDARNFRLVSGAETSTIALSQDGKIMTVTTGDDVRIYDRIDGRTWPTAKP